MTLVYTIGPYSLYLKEFVLLSTLRCFTLIGLISYSMRDIVTFFHSYPSTYYTNIWSTSLYHYFKGIEKICNKLYLINMHLWCLNFILFKKKKLRTITHETKGVWKLTIKKFMTWMNFSIALKSGHQVKSLMNKVISELSYSESVCH